jgi:ATP-independent RNA helicase DbpA
MNKFNELKISKDMLKVIAELNYNQMTPVQSQSLPAILDKKDVIVQAKTGSGKTVAFGIGVLNKLKVEKFRIQSMVLCPTRELAMQVANEIKKLARFAHNIKITTLCGGSSMRTQTHSLSHQAHIVVGTPGRILKHLEEKNFSPEDIDTLVLDEADRMLDMGFSDDILKIISFLPAHQSMLFSATYPDNIQQLSEDILVNPENIKIEQIDCEDKISQIFYDVKNQTKIKATEIILANYNPASSIIFCNTKIACDELADRLEELKIFPLVLHSDMEQRERNETLVRFANKSYPILIATDVASRGLDVKNIEVIINYDLPYDSEVYVHRIGRTARAGADGLAVSLVDKAHRFDELKEKLNISEELQDISSLDANKKYVEKPEYSTIFINGGKKEKVRAGDILGSLIKGAGLDKNDIGKIDILEFCSYVAVKKEKEKEGFDGLSKGKIKGKFFRVFLK